jgi:hypothetical protein
MLQTYRTDVNYLFYIILTEQVLFNSISTFFLSLTTADARTRYILFNANTIFAANKLAFTHTYKVLQEVKRHVTQDLLCEG